ncbi:MAG: response regulator [Anaerolineales bacterium]|nr:response regulator [Anaerolineales bacterium]MDW8278238.1 response regulator [Anaerolineales bacterium]
MTAPRILVVDDEPGITLLCERLLTRAGFQVVAHTDPALALELLKKERYDLLLVDIRMPEISGFDVVQRARETQGEMAILAMTGFGTVETAIQALRRGVDGLILKPFEKDELIQAVRQALSDSQQKQDAARVQALRPLFSVTETLLSETRPDHLLELILDVVSTQLRCSNVGFYQVIEKDNRLNLLAGRGKLLPDGTVSEHGNPVARAAALDAPVWGGMNDPRLKRDLYQLELSSMMCVPTSLVNISSVLFVARDAGEPVFREADLEMFLILARQATIAMENARLYEELRAYVRRVEESQQALVQAEKLAAAGRLTASIAHEINNPLQGVRNCFHLATREDVPAEMRQKYLEMTQQELDRLMTTVQRMLDFYRPSAEFKPVQVLDLLEHVLNLLGPQLRERNIRVTTAWPARLPSIRAISNQIEQVFINLVLNAFDAMPEGGELWISIAQKRKMIEILFQDTGPGVPPEVRAHIFEPFVSTKGSGTGLGLSVSYDIVTAHGGKLDLLPDRKPGACFRLLLPIHPAREMNA